MTARWIMRAKLGWFWELAPRRQILDSDISTSEGDPVLANGSFEQLSQIQISTASKRPEALAETPAAVRVVTSEDRQRSGATSIPEGLCGVVSLGVALSENSVWDKRSKGRRNS